MARINYTEAAEREAYVVELIKESGKAGVTLKEIGDDIGMPPNNRTTYMARLAEKHTEIKRLGTPRHFYFIWDDESAKPAREVHSPFVKNRYEKTNKNNEGYTDMTATNAIKNVERKPVSNFITPNPGEIWTAEESNGSTGYIYVIGYEDDAAQCIKLFDIKTCASPEDIKHPMRVKLGAVTLIGDCSRTTFKLKKYLVKRSMGTKDEVLMTVRKELADILGISSFRIKEVEAPVRVEQKIVYKDPEPVVVPEGYMEIKDAMIADLQHQVESWRAAFWGVVKRDRVDTAKIS